MENPNHKWRYLAGKLIYKWAMASMAMLVITRGRGVSRCVMLVSMCPLPSAGNSESAMWYRTVAGTRRRGKIWSIFQPCLITGRYAKTDTDITAPQGNLKVLCHFYSFI